MQSDLVSGLLKYIIIKLEQDEELKQYSHGVYTYVPNNIISPYIFINKANAKDWSSKTFNGLEIEVGLAAITKETSLQNVLTISSYIRNLLELTDTVLDDCILVKSKFENSSIHFRNSTQTFQISNNIKFFIQEMP